MILQPLAPLIEIFTKDTSFSWKHLQGVVLITSDENWRVLIFVGCDFLHVRLARRGQGPDRIFRTTV